MLAMPPVLWVPLGSSAKCPDKKRRSDAGWDFYSAEDYSVGPFSTIAVHTGIALAIPGGWYGQLQGRSGLASKAIQPRAFLDENDDVLGGAIDCTYRGEVIILLANIGRYRFEIKSGDKIAQMMFHPVPDTRFDRAPNGVLPPGERGASGFGDSDGSGQGGTVRKVNPDGSATEYGPDGQRSIVGSRLPAEGDPYRFQDAIKSLDKQIRKSIMTPGTAVPPKEEPEPLKDWVLRLANDLYTSRRDYTNLTVDGFVNHVARKIQNACVAEGVRMVSEMKSRYINPDMEPPSSRPFVKIGPGMYESKWNGGWILGRPNPSTYVRPDFGPPSPVSEADVKAFQDAREKFEKEQPAHEDFSGMIGEAINRILERRRLVHDVVSDSGLRTMDGPTAVRTAIEIWGKDHPIIREICNMFRVPYPEPVDVQPGEQRVTGWEDIGGRDPGDEQPAEESAFKVPPTINIQTGSKTGPSMPDVGRWRDGAST